MSSNTVTETIYLTRNNANDLLLTSVDVDGVTSLADMRAVTKVEIVDSGCAFTIASDTSAGAFSWSSTVADGKLQVKLGQEPIPPATYTCKLILYDPTNPDGIVWGELKLTFKKACPVVTP